MSKWLDSWLSDNKLTEKVIRIDKNSDNLTFGFDFYDAGNHPIWDVRIGTGPAGTANYDVFYHYLGAANRLVTGVNTFLFKLVPNRPLVAGELLYLGIGLETSSQANHSLLRNFIVNTDGTGEELLDSR